MITTNKIKNNIITREHCQQQVSVDRRFTRSSYNDQIIGHTLITIEMRIWACIMDFNVNDLNILKVPLKSIY